jgi:hypothetical protein
MSFLTAKLLGNEVRLEESVTGSSKGADLPQVDLEIGLGTGDLVVSVWSHRTCAAILVVRLASRGRVATVLRLADTRCYNLYIPLLFLPN